MILIHGITPSGGGFERVVRMSFNLKRFESCGPGRLTVLRRVQFDLGFEQREIKVSTLCGDSGDWRTLRGGRLSETEDER